MDLAEIINRSLQSRAQLPSRSKMERANPTFRSLWEGAITPQNCPMGDVASPMKIDYLAPLAPGVPLNSNRTYAHREPSLTLAQEFRDYIVEASDYWRERLASEDPKNNPGGVLSNEERMVAAQWEDMRQIMEREHRPHYQVQIVARPEQIALLAQYPDA